MTTLLLSALLVSGGVFSLLSNPWLAASARLVFEQGQVWRLWTSLFIHGDPAHLLSNFVLFLPLCYVLSGYFGPFFFPGWALIMGGVVNGLVLITLPPDTILIGISGMVYWMGGAWLALYARIDRRDPLRRRFAKVVIFSLVLFFPETFQPNVSYLSHSLGFLLGVFSGLIYYGLFRRRFLKAEVVEQVFEDLQEEGHTVIT